MSTIVKIIEAGNGFPVTGQIIIDAGAAYRIVEIDGTIHTDAPGRGNYIYGRVAPCEWPEDDYEVYLGRMDLVS